MRKLMKTMNIVCEEEFMRNLKKRLQNSTTTPMNRNGANMKSTKKKNTQKVQMENGVQTNSAI